MNTGSENAALGKWVNLKNTVKCYKLKFSEVD